MCIGMCIVCMLCMHVSVVLHNIIANQFDSKKWIGKKSSKIAKICMCFVLYCLHQSKIGGEQKGERVKMRQECVIENSKF